MKEHGLDLNDTIKVNAARVKKKQEEWQEHLKKYR
jgi:hypothetical protein